MAGGTITYFLQFMAVKEQTSFFFKKKKPTQRFISYRNDPKFSGTYPWANSADPDQTAPRGAVWSGSTLFAIPSASLGLITLW